ncbi:MAG: type II CAAX endopeptidase family protein [Gemmatimonadales bacterium]
MTRRPKRIAAVLEVVAVLVGGSLVARTISDRVGLARSRALINALPEGASPDFLAMAWVSALDLLLKYGIMFGLAFAIGWWHRRRPLRAYGLTLAGRPLAQHVGTGWLLFAVAFLPVATLMVLASFVSLGAGPEHWSVFSYEWSLGFWVFMAVSSFLVVPILEELFVRGYIQTRLIEDFGAAGGILITAFVFAFSHTQYFRLSVMSIGTLAGIVFSSILAGYVFYRTRSLLPVVIAHAITNVPLRATAEIAMLGLMVMTIILFREPILSYGRALWLDFSRIESVPAALALALFALFLVALLLAPPLALALVVAAAVLALVVEYREKAALAGNSAIRDKGD